jgi:flagellar biosynthesis/type III secretory pathway M-ring protein FliF/YscJ
MEMNEFIRMFLRMFIQVGPYLVVFVVLGYIIKLQEKKAKEREEEQKKGIIKTHYVVKTEKYSQ